MSIPHLLVMTAIVILPLAASAQEKHPDWHPADPNAPTMQFQYESAFKNYHAGNDEGDAPDRGWRAANAALTPQAGQQGRPDRHAGHAGHEEDPSMTATPNRMHHMHHMLSAPPEQAAPAAPEEWEPVDRSHHHH